jgi:hypothetical protein
VTALLQICVQQTGSVYAICVTFDLVAALFEVGNGTFTDLCVQQIGSVYAIKLTFDMVVALFKIGNGNHI